MATIETTKTICDRCWRDAPTRKTTDGPALAVAALGEDFKFHDLCAKCSGVCRDHMRIIAKQPTLRKRPKKEAPAEDSNEVAK